MSGKPWIGDQFALYRRLCEAIVDCATEQQRQCPSDQLVRRCAEEIFSKMPKISETAASSNPQRPP